MSGTGRTLVVAHDAGGAEVISAWVKRQAREEFSFLLEGPAERIFRRKLPGIAILSREQAMKELATFDRVLCGTSWASDLEVRLLQEARLRGIRSVSYLDHWFRYSEVFRNGGKSVFPDEVWAGDQHAIVRARREFPPEVKIRLEPNLYWEEIVAEVAVYEEPRAVGEPPRVLYVTEPIADSQRVHTGIPKALGYDELEALEYFLRWLGPRRGEVGKIRLRPHPAERREKYLPIIERYRKDFDLELSPNAELARDCAWSDWVVGCYTMAMVVGVLARRRVLCSIPPHGAPSPLPFPEIEQLA